jgi:hypothetical protein
MSTAPPPDLEEYNHIVDYYDTAHDDPEAPPPPPVPAPTLRNGTMNGQPSGPLPPRQASLHLETTFNEPPGEQEPKNTHTRPKCNSPDRTPLAHAAR